MNKIAHSAAALTLAAAIALVGTPTATASAPPTAATSRQHISADGGGRSDCAPLCNGDNNDGPKHKKIKKFEQQLHKAIKKAIKKAREYRDGDKGGCTNPVFCPS